MGSADCSIQTRQERRVSFEYTRKNATVFDGYGEDVKVGDKITVVVLVLDAHGRPVAFGTKRSDSRRGVVENTNITNGYNQRGFRWREVDNRHEWLGWLEGEGVRWIRGWHGARSAAVSVLLAAGQLVRSAA